MADTTPTNAIKLGFVSTKPPTARTQAVPGSEKLTQTWKRGACVQHEASTGFVKECTAPLASGAPATTMLTGVAPVAAHNNAASGSNDVLVEDAKLNYFEGTISKDAGTHTLGQADVGKLMTVSRDATSKNWYIEETTVSEAAGGAFILALKDPIGTVDGRVVFRFTKGVISGS